MLTTKSKVVSLALFYGLASITIFNPIIILGVQSFDDQRSQKYYQANKALQHSLKIQLVTGPIECLECCAFPLALHSRVDPLEGDVEKGICFQGVLQGSAPLGRGRKPSLQRKQKLQSRVSKTLVSTTGRMVVISFFPFINCELLGVRDLSSVSLCHSVFTASCLGRKMLGKYWQNEGNLGRVSRSLWIT